jgi:hypothetical protein
VVEVEPHVVALIGPVSLAGWVLLAAGLLRIPWRYALWIGLGVGLVLVAGTLTTEPFLRGGDARWSVLMAAIGAAVAMRAYDRGKRARAELVTGILRKPESERLC